MEKMEKGEFRILFLDDEIYDEKSNPAVFARETLQDAGYAVDVTDKMSDVIDAYYKRYYHLYLLDIDMGKVKDEFVGNGATVGEVLRRLSSISNVVVYSARGTVNDWLTAANYHFNSYVHKDEGEEKLLAVVDEIFETVKTRVTQLPSLQKREHTDEVVIYGGKEISGALESLRKMHTVAELDSLEELAARIKEQKPAVAVLVLSQLPQSQAEMAKFTENLKMVMALQSTPHVMVCLDAIRNNPNILKIVNTRPFRILNLHSPVFEREFLEAVEKAVLWFGEDEIYEFPEAGKIIRKPMTEREIADLRKEDWDDSDWDESGSNKNE